MDDDGIEAADLEHHHVAGKLLGELAVDHGVTAIFHHDDLIVIALQKGQGFREDAGGFGNRNVGHGSDCPSSRLGDAL